MGIKHYVQYEMPGSFFAETSTIEVPERRVDIAKSRAPENAYAFEFYSVREPDFEWNEEHFDVIPRAFDRSNKHYLGGSVLTQENVERENTDGRYDILLSNMRGNRWDRVIRTPFGNTQPFEEGDVVV